MKLQNIGHGYRVSDIDAGRLARAVGLKLPPRGYEIDVVLPQGEHAWLARTPFRYGTYDLAGKLEMKTPARGWVWMLNSTSDLEHYTRPPLARRRALMQKARRVAEFAKKQEVEAMFSKAGDRTKFERAIDAYSVAADAYEEAGDMLEAMANRKSASRLSGLIRPAERDRRRRRSIRRLKPMRKLKSQRRRQ